MPRWPGLFPKPETVTRDAAWAAGAVGSAAAARPTIPSARVVAAATARRREVVILGGCPRGSLQVSGRSVSAEHDRPVPVEQDPVLRMPAHRARQGTPFDVLPECDQVVDVPAVV